MNDQNNSLQPDLSDTLPDLTQVRQQISSLDRELIELLAKRRGLSEAVVLHKQTTQKPIRDQLREQYLLESLVKYGRELKLDASYITKLFHLIIEDSINFQQKYLQSLLNPELQDHSIKRLAVLGGEGSYSYLAARSYFAEQTHLNEASHAKASHPANSSFKNSILGFSSFDKVLKSVEENSADYGIVPIENTTSGSISEVLDLLLEANLSIIGETKYAIEHCLVVAPGTKLADIKTIYAHPEASRQCNKNLKQSIALDVTLVSSTAKALQLIKQNSNSLAATQANPLAAIASKEAAELYGLEVLLSNVANQRDNTTRFFILAKKPVIVSPQVSSKTSLAISTGQKPGSLAQVLNLFSEANITLSKLESRPIPEKPWEQMFYLDLEGNIGDPKVQQLMEELTKLCRFVKVLGCYPSADITATKVSAKLFEKTLFSGDE